MHINGKELISTSFKPATIEGRINYKAVQLGKSIVKSGNFKEFWFKLTGNLLFYFGLNSYGGIKGNEPIGVFVLENMSVCVDEEGAASFAFIITYSGDSERHVFSCFNSTQIQNWMVALRQANYEHLRIQVKILEEKLESLGGKSLFSWNNAAIPRYRPADDVPPIVPPRMNRSVGPKTNSFVSHAGLLNNNNNGQERISGSSSQSGATTDDLIKW